MTFARARGSLPIPGVSSQTSPRSPSGGRGLFCVSGYALAMASVNATLGECITHRYGIRAACTECGHVRELDLEALAAKLGRDHGALRDDLAPKLRCTECGSKRIALTTLAPDVPTWGGPA